MPTSPNPPTSRVSSHRARTRRTNPDVAYDANPSTGVPVYDSYDTSTPWGQWGGTSIAAPQWAAVFAIADQARAAAGEGPLSSTQALSLLYGTYNSPSYSSDFHDITSGTSTGHPKYSAGPGYDLVTGLGTPDRQPTGQRPWRPDLDLHGDPLRDHRDEHQHSRLVIQHHGHGTEFQQ